MAEQDEFAQLTGALDDLLATSARVPLTETAPLPEARGGPNSPAPDSPLG